MAAFKLVTNSNTVRRSIGNSPGFSPCKENTLTAKVRTLIGPKTTSNNNFDLVDEVVKEAQGTATIFVKNGEEYVRVATNVKKDDGTRAVGTILDPKGKAIESIKKDEPFYGKPYITGYKPIRDASKNVIGIYYVGYMK